ncbi:D-serine ammonia-lyase [Neptunomonas marina]|uniref:Probable D-serine dehydratase n=1 Tax=Neptunomonas marina TaxID=1815562 RepID=A0A437Q9F5_9GAMM|nr:D-serine ammonia-lyase [Neptunomonas marina]RVU31067.1 D-serine ammonia-lyase [Neptunomonas marina]
MSASTLSQNQLQALQQQHPLLWLNSYYEDTESAPLTPDPAELDAAEARLALFAPLLAHIFPELEPSAGIIESPLLSGSALAEELNLKEGQLWFKGDHLLPVAGSIKARGGIHEVLWFAERVAKEHNLLGDSDNNCLQLATDAARHIFADYTITVGSTGNLGLSIGIIGAALGFKTVVHMSADAKEWKKTRLRERGVIVVEHSGDYGAAVEAGRKASTADPKGYFVDDERSTHLFMGYAVAARRLAKQLEANHITVNQQHPLFVYLPAGVGGAPGGIMYGLKSIFGAHVHCFFAEPTAAPCMLTGMATTPAQPVQSVYDAGLDGLTEADGLAVGTASQWVCDATRDLLSGVYTASDKSLFSALLRLKIGANIEVEPSAAISYFGPTWLDSPIGQHYQEAHGLTAYKDNATHICWLTGGSFVPPEEYQAYLNTAQQLSS